MPRLLRPEARRSKAKRSEAKRLLGALFVGWLVGCVFGRKTGRDGDV